MTRLLFVHQNMPGQYRETVAALSRMPGREIVFLTQRRDLPDVPGVRRVVYAPHHKADADAYGLARVWEDAAGAGYGAARAAAALKADGFTPDLILGHTGWGEMLFLREVWPDAPMLGLFEYYYRASGGPVGFDPEEPVGEHAPFLLSARNAVPNAMLPLVDRGYAPTVWQKGTFPDTFQSKLYVGHEGIRTDLLTPDPDASIALGRAGRLTRADEVVTYVARNLERTRGFHVLMRALPRLLSERPHARVVIVGGTEVSYGKASGEAGGFRAEMEAEVGDRVDWDRVHFVGRVPYDAFRRLVQVSRCHVYLTMPFVLSWSLLEAMAMGATVVASDVAPVREAVTHGRTGLLVDYFDPDALAAQVAEVCADPDRFAPLGRAARDHAVAAYDFRAVCLPRHVAEMNALLPRDRHIRVA